MRRRMREKIARILAGNGTPKENRWYEKHTGLDLAVVVQKLREADQRRAREHAEGRAYYEEFE